MSEKNPFHSILNEVYETLHLLYYSVNMETKNTLLHRLEEQISRLSQAAECGVDNAGNESTFTLDELHTFNGRNGRPAYVAVDGVVYDVTNQSVWAAASHFGLRAGEDLTSEFASCHANRDILSKLKAVGRLRHDRLY